MGPVLSNRIPGSIRAGTPGTPGEGGKESFAPFTCDQFPRYPSPTPGGLYTPGRLAFVHKGSVQRYPPTAYPLARLLRITFPVSCDRHLGEDINASDERASESVAEGRDLGEVVRGSRVTPCQVLGDQDGPLDVPVWMNTSTIFISRSWDIDLSTVACAPASKAIWFSSTLSSAVRIMTGIARVA